MRLGLARKTLPVNRQDIFDERIAFVFPGEIHWYWLSAIKCESPWTSAQRRSRRRGATAPARRHRSPLATLRICARHIYQRRKSSLFELGAKHQEIDRRPRPGESDIGDTQRAQALKPLLALRRPLHRRAKRLETSRSERRWVFGRWPALRLTGISTAAKLCLRRAGVSHNAPGHVFRAGSCPPRSRRAADRRDDRGRHHL